MEELKKEGKYLTRLIGIRHDIRTSYCLFSTSNKCCLLWKVKL